VSLLSVLEDGEIYYVYRDGVEVEITKCSDFGLALRCSVILGKLCFINSTEKGSIKCTWGLAPRALNQQNHSSPAWHPDFYRTRLLSIESAYRI
jgi:hypothetical protein